MSIFLDKTALSCGKNKLLRYYRVFTYRECPILVCLTYLHPKSLSVNLNLHDFCS